MKNIRIPFNLSEYKKGGYEVETRDGRSARIVCTDCMSSYPIIALVKEDITCENKHSYHSNGTFIENYNSSYDLFLKKQELEDGKCWNAEKKCIEDIKEECELKPFQKVLVRYTDNNAWKANMFSHFIDGTNYNYICIDSSYRQCIPYEGNEELLGTTNSPKQ